jgi:hypothetical protein
VEIWQSLISATGFAVQQGSDMVDLGFAEVDLPNSYHNHSWKIMELCR